MWAGEHCFDSLGKLVFRQPWVSEQKALPVSREGILSQLLAFPTIRYTNTAVPASSQDKQMLRFMVLYLLSLSPILTLWFLQFQLIKETQSLDTQKSSKLHK